MYKHHIGIGGNQLTDGDHGASEAAAKLHSMLQSLCISAVEARSENLAHTMLILVQAANGVLNLLARSAMTDKERDEPISSTATLFAALFAYHCSPCEHEKGKTIAEFSPLVIHEALKDVERLSGQRPDERLNEVMCRVARKCAANPAMIAEISRARSVPLRDGATLN